MSRVINTHQYPGPPTNWSASDREAWNQLIGALQRRDTIERARNNTRKFFIKGTVSAPVTVDLASPSVTALTLIVANLLEVLNDAALVNSRNL